jgi:cation transport regulator ChaB
MPQVDGPKGLNTLLENVYSDCKKNGGTEEACSKQAWSVAKKSYYKDSKGKWRKRQ